MKELVIYTAQIGKYKGPDAVDITVKSGVQAFAPTWHMVMGIKTGTMDWEKYSARYRSLMAKSLEDHPTAWDTILNSGTTTLMCYCRDGQDCHRYLLADILREVGKERGVKVIYAGERGAEASLRNPVHLTR